jgi:hypothetical protein
LVLFKLVVRKISAVTWSVEANIRIPVEVLYEWMNLLLDIESALESFNTWRFQISKWRTYQNDPRSISLSEAAVESRNGVMNAAWWCRLRQASA